MANNNTAIQLARKEIVGLLEKQKAQITMALPKHLTADRICRIAITEMGRNPKLFECEKTSVLASIVMAAQLGLEPGINGQCYLVPYKGVCQLIPGWQGFVDLISRAGRASVWTGAVRDGDQFSYALGSNPLLEHVPGDDDEGNFTHVYAVGWVKGAQWPVIEVWSRAKVLKHLKAYNKVGNMHYALQNENNLEMYGRKVALLQVMKYMPKSVELSQAQTLEYRGSEGLQKLTFSTEGVTEAEYVDASGESMEAQGSDAELRERIHASLNEKNPTWNTAQRNAYIGNYKGSLQELLDKLTAQESGTSQSESKSEGSASNVSSSSTEQRTNAPQPSGNVPSNASSSQRRENPNPDLGFDQSREFEPEPQEQTSRTNTASRSTSRSNRGGGFGF